MNPTNYPLKWPYGWRRTYGSDISRFGRYTFEQMRVEVLRELNLLGATDIVISSNMKIRQDGYPYSGQSQPADPGIAVYFKLDGQDQCIPCDKWHKTEDNLRAIVKTVEALRGIERWGAKDMVNAAFAGFKALPASTIVPRRWHEVLGVEESADSETIRRNYKERIRKYHPDNPDTGDADKFAEIQEAYKQSGG